MQPVITLCGSTKFKAAFFKAAERLGNEGALVITVTTFTHADNLDTTAEEMALLDAVHMQKIMISDEIYVINQGGYIGESTLREIAFAAIMKKTIRFMEQPTIPVQEMLSTIGIKGEKN
jgi:hypothetical protein